MRNAMNSEIKLYEQGLEEYPKSSIILSNLMMTLWIVLGTIACWFLNPIFAWIYLAFAVIMVGIVLRKLVCTHCYYYDKWCCLGWGKLSALFFKQGDMNRFNTSIGLTLAGPTYGLLSLIPTILIIISMIQEFLLSKLIVLLLLLLVSFYSGTISRKSACANCKMRLICPGSAVHPNTNC